MEQKLLEMSTKSEIEKNAIIKSYEDKLITKQIESNSDYEKILADKNIKEEKIEVKLLGTFTIFKK